MCQLYSVSIVARKLCNEWGIKVRPRTISDLFYARELDDDRCPIVGGRRLIDDEYLPEIARLLRRKGWISQSREATP